MNNHLILLATQIHSLPEGSEGRCVAEGEFLELAVEFGVAGCSVGDCVGTVLAQQYGYIDSPRAL